MPGHSLDVCYGDGVGGATRGGGSVVGRVWASASQHGATAGRCASACFSIRRCALRGRIMCLPGSPWPRTGDQWPLCPGVFRDCLGRCAPSPVCVTWGLGSEGGHSPGLPGGRCALTNFAVDVDGTARRHTAVSALGPGCVGDGLTSAASAGKGEGPASVDLLWKQCGLRLPTGRHPHAGFTSIPDPVRFPPRGTGTRTGTRYAPSLGSRG